MKRQMMKYAKFAARRVRRVSAGRSGLTLIELIVAMAVATIVMSAIVGIFIMTYRSYDAGNMHANAQNLAVMTLQKIDNAVRYKNTITIYSDKSAVPGTELPVYYDSGSDGIKIGSDTYLQGSFKNYKCVLVFSNDNYSADAEDNTKNNLLKIDVTITDNSGNTLFKTTGSVYLLNGKIDNNSTGAAVTYS